MIMLFHQAAIVALIPSGSPISKEMFEEFPGEKAQ